MKRILRLMQALTGLKLRGLYHMILQLSVARMPEITVKETAYGLLSGFRNDDLLQQDPANETKEPHFEALVTAILKPTDTVLDVGGNIGTHAMFLSRTVSNGHVYTFEPQSLVFSILQNNLLLNSCRNVTAYRFAVSDEDFRVVAMEPFSFSGDKINNGALRVDLKQMVGDLVLTRTIDSFNFGEVAFVKLDIQGSEVRALEGARTLLSESQPYLFVELEEQHLRALNTSTQELIQLLFNLGYALYRIENDYPCDHICLPVSKAEYFETHVLPKLPFVTSPKIFGSNVEVVFSDVLDQNYTKLVVS